MSQSGRLNYGTGPVPGAGIQTITGNNGLPNQIHGDGAANVNILGAGAITVTGDAANTLTISSTAVPALYTTDAGFAAPDISNNINILGGTAIHTTGDGLSSITIDSTATYVTDIAGPVVPTAPGDLNVVGAATPGIVPAAVNIQTTGAVANTVGIYLVPSIAVDRVSADTSIRTGGVIQALGNISSLSSIAAASNIEADGDFVLPFGRFNVGGSTGSAGQVLTSNGAAAPSWQGSVAPSGSTVSSFFARQAINSGYITGDNIGTIGYLGTAAVMSLAAADCFNTGGYFHVGNGAGTPANFTAPLTGTYFFSFQIVTYQSTGASLAPVTQVIFNSTQGITYSLEHSFGAAFVTTHRQMSEYIHLNAGDVVLFGIQRSGTTGALTFGVQGNAQSFISGFKVA